MKLTRFLIAVAVVSCLVAHTSKSVLAPVVAEDFFRAIRAGNSKEVQRLTSVASVNVRDNLKTSPLLFASLFGSADSVRILLDAGADPNARNQQDATPLIYAAYDFAKTRLLVEKGAAVNVSTHIGYTPLLVASSVHGNFATVKYLLDKGADLKATDLRGDDALSIAAAMSEPETIRLLLAHGADAKRKDLGGGTAILASSSFSNAERARLLLDAGAEVNAANAFGGRVKNGPLALVHVTPLLVAAPYSEPDTIALLLKAGAHVNDVDIRKMSPLMMAVATDRAKPGTVSQLIAAGANVNARDQNGESVLDWARNFDIRKSCVFSNSQERMPRQHRVLRCVQFRISPATLPMLWDEARPYFQSQGSSSLRLAVAAPVVITNPWRLALTQLFGRLGCRPTNTCANSCLMACSLSVRLRSPNCQ